MAIVSQYSFLNIRGSNSFIADPSSSSPETTDTSNELSRQGLQPTDWFHFHSFKNDWFTIMPKDTPHSPPPCPSPANKFFFKDFLASLVRRLSRHRTGKAGPEGGKKINHEPNRSYFLVLLYWVERAAQEVTLAHWLHTFMVFVVLYLYISRRAVVY